MPIATLLLASVLLGGQTPSTFVHEPFGDYQERILHGFKVRLSFEARLNPLTTQPAYELLDQKLEEIAKILPEKALKTLRKVPIFMEHEAPGHACACYHPSRAWLLENGFIPEKWRSVEISNPKNFVDWTRRAQPMMVLHELAHGYHDIEFGHDDKYIEQCHRLAVLSGKYDSVAHIDGTQKRHYGLNNPMEYFAEATEAYFGRNDFYPFTRKELKEFDPAGYELVEKMWGVTAKPSPSSESGPHAKISLKGTR